MSQQDETSELGLRAGWVEKPAVQLVGLVVLPGLLAAGCSGSSKGSPQNDAGEDGGPTAIEFELTNATDGPVMYRPRSNCPGPTSGWISVYEAGSPLALVYHCSRCRCRDVPCSTCGEPCSRPDRRELPSGESVTWTWPGVHFPEHEIEGQSCRRELVPEADTYTARFCWSRGDSSGSGVPTPVCEDVDFEYGTETSVSFEIDGN